MVKEQNPEFTILMVDDNPKNLEVLGKTLENYNYRVEYALDGASALEWTENQMFDLILLDVMMPGLNGFEVCEKLRANPVFDNIPIIFLTAETEKSSVVKGLELGAQDYVTKPFDTAELMARVKTHLELRNCKEKLNSVNQWLTDKVNEQTEQLKKANQELMGLDHAKTEFLRMISHELRTPLNGIIGPLHLLKERNETREIEELINVLDSSVERLEKFSRVAMTITKFNVANQQIEKDPLELEELIDRSISELEEELGKKNLRVVREVASGEQIVAGDFELLVMCFTNVLLNAIKYSENDGEIHIRTMRRDSEVSCEISDQGPGFSPNAIEKLFTLFEPGESHINENLGLGLALVKMILDAHNCTIEITNNNDRGATVKLLFET